MKQANFDGLIITSPSSIFLSNTTKFLFLTSLAPCSSYKLGRAKHRCESFLSGGVLPRTKVVQVRIQTSPLTNHRLDQRSTFLHRACRTWQLEDTDMFLPSTFPNLFPHPYFLSYLFMFPSHFPPTPYQASAGCAWSWQNRAAGAG